MKKNYESPKVFKLDETASALGATDCDVGSGAGSCGNGQGAAGACAYPGNSAGVQCVDGNDGRDSSGRTSIGSFSG